MEIKIVSCKYKIFYVIYYIKTKMVKRIKTKHMAFKMKGPLYNLKDELPVANDGSNKFKNYQASLKNTYMSSKDSGVGAYPDPQTGERTFYDKKHQSYNMKKGVENKTGSFKDGKYVMNKPKAKATATKSTSPYPAAQGGSAIHNTGGFWETVSVLASGSKKKAASDRMKAGTTEHVDINKMRADANAEQQKKIDAKNKKVSKSNNTSSNAGNTKLLTNQQREKMLADSKGQPNFSDEVDKIDKSEKVKQLKKKIKNKNKGVNTNNTNNTKNTKPIRSSDSGDLSGGFLKDTKNVPGFDIKLNVASMPKFERTVTNARSADYDLVRAKGRGRSSRLKSRLDRRQGKVENKVERSLLKIDAKQQRQGTKYAGKMKAAQISSEKGKTDPGYFDSQKKLDAFEKSMDSPKATSRTSSAGNISSGSKAPSLRTPKSSSASSNLISKPKNKKATLISAKSLTTSSKTPELRALGNKNQKSVNKSRKKATKNSKISTKQLTDIATGNKGNQHNAKAFRDQLKFEENNRNKKTTTLASGESFKNTPKKSTKRYIK